MRLEPFADRRRRYELSIDDQHLPNVAQLESGADDVVAWDEPLEPSVLGRKPYRPLRCDLPLATARGVGVGDAALGR